MLPATLQFIIAMIACAINERMLNCNPHAERFVKTIKYECLNGFIFFGERHLRYVVKEFMAHYLAERFHQGIGGQIIRGEARATNDNGTGTAIVRRSRLGGMLNYYYRET